MRTPTSKTTKTRKIDSAASMQNLFLFDIDGTIIWGGGAGEAALRSAIQTKFGKEADLSQINMAGATDRRIARDLLAFYGLPDSEENEAAFVEAYLEALPKLLQEKNGRILPGIIDLLDTIRNRPDCSLALLTGNIRKGAQIKLEHFGVWHYFPFGAFADDHYDRNHLGPFAQARASAHHGVTFDPDRTFIIGDTPRDIACGKAIGAKTVAVATGDYSTEALAQHSPDFLFADFSDPLKSLRIILGEN